MEQNAILTIDPGVVVKFAGESSLIVTSGSEIHATGATFTSNTANPTRGDWGSIKIYGTYPENSPTSYFRECTIEYGGDTESGDEISGPICIFGTTVQVANSSIRHCDGAAIGEASNGINKVTGIPYMGKAYVESDFIEDCQNGVKLLDPEGEWDAQGYLCYYTHVLNTMIFKCDDDGIYIKRIDAVSGLNTHVNKNVIAYCGNDGVYININNPTVFKYNTIAYCGGYNMELENPNMRYDINNTISYADNGHCLYTSSSVGLVQFNKCCLYEPDGIYPDGSDNAFYDGYSSNHYPAHFTYADPSTYNPSMCNFHLNWNSYGIDAGSPTGNETDSNGATPADAGAYGGPNVRDCEQSTIRTDFYLGVHDDIEDVDWDDGHEVSYRIVDEVTISVGDELTIHPTIVPPGDTVVVKFAEDASLVVEGLLVVTGISVPVRFEPYTPMVYWDGIRLINGGQANFFNTEIVHAEMGVTAYASHLSTMSTTIKDCRYTSIFMNDCSDGTIASCNVIYNESYGVFLMGSTPTIWGNQIAQNGATGVTLFDGSDVVFGWYQAPYGGNLLQYNGRYQDPGDKSAELATVGSSYLLRDCYNDFVDDSTANCWLIYCGDANPVQVPGDNNYFLGAQQSYKEWFYPNKLVQNQPLWSTSRNVPETYRSLDDFAEAQLHERNGDFAEAVSLYRSVMVNDTIPAALASWVRCRKALGDELESIRDDLATYLTFPGLERSAFWRMIALQNEDREFEMSIQNLDDFIADAADEIDSLQGMLSELNTYYEMALANRVVGKNGHSGTNVSFNLPQVGRHSEIIPTSEDDYQAKFADIRGQIGGAAARNHEASNSIPMKYALHNAYPNPFNPTTTIRFDMKKTGVAKVLVYDLLGRKVAELFNHQATAGSHEVMFDGSGLASGVYFVRMEAPGFVASKKIVLLK